jgi:hypothetical protein
MALSMSLRIGRRSKCTYPHLGGVAIILLCTTFASSWLAVSLNQQLETSHNSNQLVNEKTGQTVSARPHNENVDVTLNLDASLRMRTRFLADVEEDRRNLIRFLEETPLFTVSTEVVIKAWDLSEGGDLGPMDVTFIDEEGRTVTSKVDGRQVIQDKIQDTAAVIYSALSLKVLPKDQYYPSCPVGNEGTCDGYLINAKATAGRRHLNGAKVCGYFSALSTVQLDDGSILAMKDLAIGDNVLVGKDKFQPVYAFGHKAASKPFNFTGGETYIISTEDDRRETHQ